MNILFEVVDGNRVVDTVADTIGNAIGHTVTIHDPGVSASAPLPVIAREATLADAARILAFCPVTLQVFDITADLFAAYTGAFNEDAPLWVRRHPDFDICADEEARDAREWATHLRAFRQVA